MKTIVFDIDGTLSNASHRQHFVRSKPRNWKAFAAGIPNDPPHEDIIWLLKLIISDMNNNVFIVSARSEDERADTELWLRKHKIPYDTLFMRASKDYRDDSIIKAEILAKLIAMGRTPYMVFDDRNKVVNMWRDNGIRCLQVAPGDF